MRLIYNNMLLKIEKINNDIVNKSQKYFGDTFCDELKINKPGTYNESLVARYLIYNNKSLFSSISHKKDLVFIGTSNKKIGVDIEIYKERDRSLLDKFYYEEYEILGGKIWLNFYILWIGKESIIKYLNLNLNDIEKIILIENKNIDKLIGGLKFLNKMKFKYKNTINNIYSGVEGKVIYSICV